jgi:pyridoxamine 5'-phosphate oxidase
MIKPPAEALDRFRDCIDAAVKAEEIEPTAMALATLGEDGRVAARTVLLKAWDESGFVFYTNTLSAKGNELAAHPRASLLFHWKTTVQQVRIEGLVEPVSDSEADAYFATRDRASQLGAWASLQSQPLQSRAELMKRVVKFEARYLTRKVPRPPHWSGYRVVPDMIEFWYGKRHRLHDRFRFTLEQQEWTRQRLYP